MRYLPISRTILALSLITTSFNIACGDDDPAPSDDGGGDDDGVGDEDPCDDADLLTQDDITCDQDVCTVPEGTYKGKIAFDNSDVEYYLLAGRVFVGAYEDADNQCEGDLTIAEGTEIRGTTAKDSFLTVSPGSKIHAVGTAEAPIVFTAETDDGDDTTDPAPKVGDWGGVVISGKAPANCGAECNGEGESGPYGGDNEKDDSGEFKYVIIAYGGTAFSNQDELNGLALQGVGSETELEYIHITNSGDDGIEFFGGTVNAKYLVITGVKDEAIDWTSGWTGKLQFAVSSKIGSTGENGVEASSNDNATAVPVSSPVVSNITLIGSLGDTHAGLKFDSNTNGQVWGSTTLDFNQGGVLYVLDGDGNLTTGDELTLKNNYFCAQPLPDDVASDTRENLAAINDATYAAVFDNEDLGNVAATRPADVDTCAEVLFGAAFDEATPSWIPPADSALKAENNTSPSEDDDWFTATEYYGAVEPGIQSADAWYNFAQFDR